MDGGKGGGSVTNAASRIQRSKNFDSIFGGFPCGDACLTFFFDFGLDASMEFPPDSPPPAITCPSTDPNGRAVHSIEYLTYELTKFSPGYT